MTAAFLVATCSEASAQALCGSRDQILEQLDKRYQEAPAARGLTNRNAILEILTSPTGSWTIIVSTPSGRTCVMATGTDWEPVDRVSLEPSA